MNVRRYSAPRGRTLRRGACAVLITVFLFAASSPGPQDDFVRSRASASRPANSARAEATLSGGNVKEFVPARYLKKYLRWKTEYLSTEAGRTHAKLADLDAARLPDSDVDVRVEYSALNYKDALAITGRGAVVRQWPLVPDMGHGGIVGGYRWDASGKLVAASVVLGGDLEGGYLPPYYYPVTSALTSVGERYRFGGEILAAAKIAHEVGHVNQAAESDAAEFQLQNNLIDLYAKIFKETGYDRTDPRLAEITRRMGGTPSEIKREREYGAEANALLFLEERMRGEQGDRALFRRIRKSIHEYAEGRFQLFR